MTYWTIYALWWSFFNKCNAGIARSKGSVYLEIISKYKCNSSPDSKMLLRAFVGPTVLFLLVYNIGAAAIGSSALKQTNLLAQCWVNVFNILGPHWVAICIHHRAKNNFFVGPYSYRHIGSLMVQCYKWIPCWSLMILTCWFIDGPILLTGLIGYWPLQMFSFLPLL